MSMLPARGEVWWCEMAEIGRRPVVVLSRDAVIQTTQQYLGRLPDADDRALAAFESVRNRRA